MTKNGFALLSVVIGLLAPARAADVAAPAAPAESVTNPARASNPPAGGRPPRGP
ncbi:MAG TPA: hypothetical protein PKM73_21095 [Verrucomicrobiota bacterium]|nr:hypothetical protein [Verrucomicrobiota bacterium]HNU50648.1 hypothetical protein [Verrucomicrobiota bacterium]